MVKYWQGKGAFEFDEFRSYVPGDDLRKMDWNIYRRLQELVVKEYVVEMPTHLIIALDTSASMGCYQKFEYALQVTAALVYIGLSLLDPCYIFYLSPRYAP